MFLGEKVGKSKKQEYLHRLFSNQADIHYWESIYKRKDFWGLSFRKRMSLALSWLDDLNLQKNAKILDIGCGAGVMVREIANRGYEVFGMDYSYNMVKKAVTVCDVAKQADIDFLQGDIESLPFKDSVFDMVLCLGVITYLKSEEKALQEISRILKPNGILILSILNKASLAKCLDISVLVKRRLERVLRRKIIYQKSQDRIKGDYSTLRSYFIPSLRNSLEIAGFRELDCVAVQYGPLTFFGRRIFPEGINISITAFLEEFSGMPVIRSFGNMCLFKLRKVR